MKKRLWSFLAVCLMAVSMAFAQQTIVGKVIDKSTGEPVVGASVLVKGTTTGAATDLNGAFTINNAPAHGGCSQSYLCWHDSSGSCRKKWNPHPDGA